MPQKNALASKAVTTKCATASVSGARMPYPSPAAYALVTDPHARSSEPANCFALLKKENTLVRGFITCKPTTRRARTVGRARRNRTWIQKQVSREPAAYVGSQPSHGLVLAHRVASAPFTHPDTHASLETRNCARFKAVGDVLASCGTIQKAPGLHMTTHEIATHNARATYGHCASMSGTCLYTTALATVPLKTVAPVIVEGMSTEQSMSVGKASIRDNCSFWAHMRDRTHTRDFCHVPLRKIQWKMTLRAQWQPELSLMSVVAACRAVTSLCSPTQSWTALGRDEP